MSKASSNRLAFRCVECGWATAKWVGRCGECQAWGTVSDDGGGETGPRTKAVAPGVTGALPISEVDATAAAQMPSGIDEFDRVLGGGLVPGAVILMAGEPGVGKSTLLLEVAAQFARGHGSGLPTGDGSPANGEQPWRSEQQTEGARSVLYVTGEESASQVRLRAERIGAMTPRLLLAAETDLGRVLGHIAATNPALIIVDSVQTIASVEVEGSPGGVAQVREVTACLIREAKTRAIPVLLVGHVTKDGSVAGPRTLEHLVDVVCQFDGDRHSRLRTLRTVKNRYGPTDEIGCFDLSEKGITGLVDPSGLFLSHLGAGVAGSCVTVTLEGRRPLALEIQALVAPSALPNPRRAGTGIDSARIAQVLAVLFRYSQVQVVNQDVYLATVGGARAVEPAADLAIALAIVSSLSGTPLPPGTVAFGEVGLAGDLRPVTGIERRIAEAARLGFTRAVVPAGTSSGLKGAALELLEVSSITTAVALLEHLPSGASQQCARH